MFRKTAVVTWFPHTNMMFAVAVQAADLGLVVPEVQVQLCAGVGSSVRIV